MNTSFIAILAADEYTRDQVESLQNKTFPTISDVKQVIAEFPAEAVRVSKPILLSLPE